MSGTGDYISREAALDAISEWLMKALHPENMSSYNDGERAAYRTTLSEIAELPAADVQPVVRGEWEHTEGFDEYGGGRYVEWTCSVCFSKAKGGWAVRDEHIDEPPAWNYCPNCGADMREES